METETKSLGTELPKEIERCQELLEAYASLGPVGLFGHAVIKLRIAAAHKAMLEGDCIAMLQAYEDLKGCE